MSGRVIPISDALMAGGIILALLLFFDARSDIKEMERSHDRTRNYVSALTLVMAEHGVPAEEIPAAPWSDEETED